MKKKVSKNENAILNYEKDVNKLLDKFVVSKRKDFGKVLTNLVGIGERHRINDILK